MNSTLLQTFQEVKGKREKDQQDAALFVVNCQVYIANQKGLHFGVKIVGKLYALHHVSKICHTEIDYKSNALNFRQEGRGTLVVQAVEGNDGVDDDMNNL